MVHKKHHVRTNDKSKAALQRRVVQAARGRAGTWAALAATRVRLLLAVVVMRRGVAVLVMRADQQCRLGHVVARDDRGATGVSGRHQSTGRVARLLRVQLYPPLPVC